MRRRGKAFIDEAGRWSFDVPPPPDVDTLAAAQARRGVAAWDGPAAHVLVLQDGRRVMTAELAQAAVDFAFDTPSAALSLELVCEDLDAAWRPLWLAVQHARRRSEWSRRRLLLTARYEKGNKDEFLRGHGVARRLVLHEPKAAAVERVLARVGPGADARRWVETLSGCGSVRFEPRSGWKGFLAFYEKALDRMLDGGPRDEWAMGLLAARPWALPGVDVLGELAYGPDGAVATSERALGLDALRLGRLGTLRFRDLAESELVRSCVLAAMPDAQPQCSTCAYRAYCSVGASAHLRDQGTLWGRLPTSPSCSLHMGVLDALFSRLDSEKTLSTLRNWDVDIV